MKVVEMNIESLIPYEFNNKIHDETQVNRIANSIKEFWFTQPIVIDSNNIIIIWHGRFEASKKLWFKKVPCYVIDQLNDKQIKKLRILDNKLNESSRDVWNLQLELSELWDMNIWDIEIWIDELFDDVLVKDDDYWDDFSLPDEQKSNLMQITFIITKEQKDIVYDILEKAKQDEWFNSMNTYWNENSNWNALLYIVQQWQQQKK